MLLLLPRRAFQAAARKSKIPSRRRRLSAAFVVLTAAARVCAAAALRAVAVGKVLALGRHRRPSPSTRGSIPHTPALATISLSHPILAYGILEPHWRLNA